MAHILGHLHRHAGIVQSNHRHTRWQSQLHQRIDTSAGIEERFEIALLVEQLLWRFPHDGVIGTGAAWLPQLHIGVGQCGAQPGNPGCRILVGTVIDNFHQTSNKPRNLFQAQQFRALHHLVSWRVEQLGHLAIDRRCNSVLHLHGVHHRQRLPLLDHVARLD